MEDALRLIKGRQAAKSGRGRELRLRAGLSLREVGEAVGVHATTILAWEGGATPHADAARRYALFLDMIEKATA